MTRKRKLQDEEGIILENESQKKEFLDKCEETVSKVFKERQAEEIKAFNKQKDFVLRWT